MSYSIFNKKIDEEYVPFINDIIKMTVILVVVNALMFLTNPKKNRFMGSYYIKLMIFICILLFYLAIAKNFEPLLLLPIGFGGLLSNIPIA